MCYNILQLTNKSYHCITYVTLKELPCNLFQQRFFEDLHPDVIVYNKYVFIIFGRTEKIVVQIIICRA